MALSAKLQLRQSQSLVMTPQLMQAIKLLQLSNLDLVAYVETELERNPLLERDEGEDGTDEEPPAAASDGVDPAETGEWIERGEAPSADSISAVLDSEITNLYPDDGAPEARPLDAAALVGDPWSGASAGRGEDYDLEAFVAAQTSLRDHLTAQLLLAESDPVRRMIGQDLIEQIDETGYLRADLAAVAMRLGAPEPLVAELLAVIQGFDPVGVGARDLGECLALQLAERDRLDPCMAALLANLDLLARRDFAALRRLCRADEEDLAEMIEEIRCLDPRPGNAFGGGVVHPVVPDVIVRPHPAGGWAIDLNAETLPRVLVNQVYCAEVARSAKADGEKAFLTECLQSANWLVKSLDQRAKTILKVAAEIVVQQDAFLARGVAFLRPLNLRTVADAIGMHESTVSRVTSNKYVATPRGIFELKYFFTAAIASASGGDAHSAEAVRHRIRQMIDAEGAEDVLSDDTIVKRLREAGIDIARRTVAKYREAMRIPSSVQRRREKQALAS